MDPFRELVLAFIKQLEELRRKIAEEKLLAEVKKYGLPKLNP